ncbi:MAG TPA: phage major capsid protein [Actinomycetota bacterium]|nr:phage major capsid protein [Actinomycetota bacterium]
MPYDNVISRTDVAALIPEEVSNAILTSLRDQSAALTLFRRITVPRNQSRLPVLSALPTAYFVNGDTGLKQTTEMAWANKYINVEELAAIVPIPETVLDDASFDVWGEVRPSLESAIGRTFDAAVFFGVNKPASWPDDILTGTTATGNVYARGTNAENKGGIAEDLNQLMALVEEDGFDVNGFVTARTFRARLRGARATDGQKLLDVSTNELEGVPVRYAMPGLWPQGPGEVEMFAGDFAQGVVGVRQDFTYKVLDQAVIQDNTGAIVYNLAQQDMVALRVTFRVGFQVANTITWEKQAEGDRYPFAVLTAPTA